MKVALVSVPLANTRIPPLSIALLTGMLRHHGHEVTPFDLNIETFARVEPELKEFWKYYRGHNWSDYKRYQDLIYPKIVSRYVDEWVERILATGAPMIGISVNTQPVVRSITERIKKADPKRVIVCGGPTCSTIYGKMAAVPCEFEDAMISGEGEEALLDFVNAYAQTGDVMATPAARIFRDGMVLHGETRGNIKDLDALPFADFSNFDLTKYRDVDVDDAVTLPTFTSRGCVARCNFCMDYRFWGVKFRMRSPKRIADELEFQSKKYGLKQFMFADLVANGDHRKLSELGDLLIERNLGVTFWTQARIDDHLTLELLVKLRKAGLRHLNFGLESASDATLKGMRKGYDAAEAERCLRRCHEAGVTVSVNLIAGHPSEGWLDFMKTALFIFRNQKRIWNNPGVTACAVIPGSELHDEPHRFGIRMDKAADDAHVSWTARDGSLDQKARKFRKNLLVGFLKRLTFQDRAKP